MMIFVASSSDEDAKKLVFPYERNEPQLADEVMMELDSIADRVELTRLKNMGVLLDASGLGSGSYKQLATRFVRAWRDKEMEIDGKPSHVWLRRSAWLCCKGVQLAFR